MRPASFGFVFALLALPACGPALTDPDPSASEPDADTSCEHLPVPEQFDDPFEQLELRRAALIGGVVHLTFDVGGGVGGTETFLVRVGDDGAGEVIAQRRELGGFNPWVAASGPRFARMSDGFAIQILDASDPEHPILEEALPADPDRAGESGYSSSRHFGDLGVVGPQAFYCRITEDHEPQLMRIALNEPPTNAFADPVGALECGEGTPAITAGSLWATWGGNRITTWDLVDPGTPTASYQYDLAPFGAHGLLASAFTDGAVIAAELEDDATDLLLYPPSAEVHLTSLGDRHVLLGVIDRTAYVARPAIDGASDEIVSFDLSNPAAPAPTNMRIEIVASERAASLHDYVLDGHDAGALLLHDGDGRVFFVPRAGEGRARQLRVARKTALECAGK